MDNLEETIRNILVHSLGVEPNQVCAEARLREDLRADSLDVVELVSSLASHYQVRIDDISTRNIETFGQITDYIRENTVLKG